MHQRYKHLLIFTLFLFALAAHAVGADIGNGNLKVDLQSSAAGTNTIHFVNWTTVTPINVKGHFVLYYDLGFDLDLLIMATTYDSATMDGRLSIDRIETDTTGGWQKVYISREDRQTNGQGLVGINLAMVGNPEPGSYDFRVETFQAGDDPDTAVPQDSGSAQIQITEAIAGFNLTPSTLTPKAGEPFILNVTNARDPQSNPASGIITISFNDGGIHLAPDGQTLPTLVSIPVTNGQGSASQILYLAENSVVLRGKVLGGSTTVTTSPLDVLPGNLYRFDMSGYPQPGESVVAGETFGVDNDVTVTAYDRWDNLKTNFTGFVYFSSQTDSKASFANGAGNEFQFQSSFQGTHTFSGQDFNLKSAGNQTFTVNHIGSSVSETSSAIGVVAGPLQSFKFETVPNQMAGVPFELKIYDAVDSYLNPTSAQITVDFTSGGDNNSPNGQKPVLNNIQVNDGQGSAFQNLVKAGSVSLYGFETINPGNTSQTNPFQVLPNSIESLSLQGYPQSIPSEQAFADPVTVTAYDVFGNLKTDYNGTVIFSSSDTHPDVKLPAAAALIQGTRQYPGSDFALVSVGEQTISVESGGVIGTTNAIEVVGKNEIQIVRVSTEPLTVSQGQTNIDVSMEVLNNGDALFENYTADLNFRIGPTSVTSDYVIIRNFPGTAIGTGSQATLDFKVSVRGDASVSDSVSIDGSIVGYFDGIPDQVDNAQIADYWKVQRPATISIQSMSVEQDTIPQGSAGVMINTTLRNKVGLTDVADAVLTNVEFTFKDEFFTDVTQSFSVSADPGNPTFVGGGNEDDFVFYLSSNATAPTGPITVSVDITYKDANLQAPTLVTGNNLDIFQSVGAPSLQISNITPEQQTATLGQEQPFDVSMLVQNEGTSSLAINFDSNKTYVQFITGGQQYISPQNVTWPTSLRGGGTTIPPGGSSYLDFQVNRIPGDVPKGNYTILGRIESVDGFFTTSDLSNAYGNLQVQRPENIQVQKLYPSQPSATINDDTHSWQVGVALENRGESDVLVSTASSQLLLKTAGGNPAPGFIVGAPYMYSGDLTLEGSEVDTLFFPITQTGSTPGQITLDAVVGYVVNNTNQSKSIIASDQSATGMVLLQRPSDFQLVDVSSSLKSVTVGTTPEWQVEVQVSNNGEADVAIDILDADSTWLVFSKDGIPNSQFTIQAPSLLRDNRSTVLTGGETDYLVYTILGHSAGVGTYVINSGVKAVELNRSRVLYEESTPALQDTVMLVQPSNVTYQTGTLAPTQVSIGRNVEFQLTAVNNGGASVNLDPDLTTFTLSSGSEQIVASLDDSYGSIIPPQGSLRLHFQKVYMSSNLPSETYTPVVQLRGEENGFSYSRMLDMGGETVVVGEEGELAIEQLVTSTKTVTNGQTNPWYVEIGVLNQSIQDLELETVNLIFNSGTTNVSNQFGAVATDTFITGDPLLPANQSGVIRVPVASVGSSILGEVLISARVTMIDVVSGTIRFEAQINTAAEITVQTPATLQILSFASSQAAVTRGQDQSWTLGARVRNDGGSALTIDAAQTVLQSSAGIENFVVVKPNGFVGTLTDTLKGFAEDSLYFRIDNVDADLAPGQVQFNSTLAMREVNTGRVMTGNTPETNVDVQDSAVVKIVKFKADIESDSYVNRGEIFYVKALISNPGGADADQVKKATLRVNKDNPLYSFVSGVDTVSVFNIAAGESKWTDGIAVQAPNQLNESALFTSELSFYQARNDDDAIQKASSPIDSLQARVTTQNPVVFTMVSVKADTDTVSSGMTLPWNIIAEVTNQGDGIIEVLNPTVDDFKVYDSNEIEQTDYIIDPVAVDAEDRFLGKGDRTTVRFVVQETWKGAGAHRIDISVRGKDLNNTAVDPKTVTGSDTVVLTTNALVRVTETRVDSTQNNADENGDGHVNIGQDFFVKVQVRNESGQQYLDKVQVVLNALESQVLSDTQTVSRIQPNTYKEATFKVKAAETENLNGEMLTSKIISAIAIGGTGAAIKPSLDSTAFVRIYEPAELRIIATENLAPNEEKKVSLGQYFDVRVKIQNEGSETAESITLSLVPDSDLATVDSTLTLPQALPGGAVDSIDFRVKAGEQAGVVNLMSNIESALGANSGEPVPILDPSTNDTTFAILTQGAELVIDDVWPTTDIIDAGSRFDAWNILVHVRNPGQADLQFVSIADTNVHFSVNGISDPDYRVVPPEGLLRSGGFILKADTQDTLVYTITKNGELIGTADFYVLLEAIDLNTNGDSLLTAIGDSSVFVANNAVVEIYETLPEVNVFDENDFGLVNRGQDFEVSVKVRTGQNVGVENVVVQLATEGNSVISAPLDTIEVIDADEFKSATFSIQADESWDPSSGDLTEIFLAEIIEAYARNDTLPLNPRDPAQGADEAKVRIQVPAELTYLLQLGEYGGSTVVAGEEFQAVARMVNLGTAPIGVGQIELTPPEGYRVKDSLNQWQTIPVSKDFSLGLGTDSLNVRFDMIAPASMTGPDTIISSITTRPVDRNSNAPVFLSNDIDSLLVIKTDSTLLAIDYFTIKDPEGARDGVLSTEQQFILETVILSSKSLTDRKATLNPPILGINPAYELLTPPVVDIDDETDTLRWIIQAPLTPIGDPHQFDLIVTGGEGDDLVRKTRTITIERLERRTTLSLGNLVITPAGVYRDGEAYLTKNQDARISVNIANFGQAGYSGSGKVELDLKESGLILEQGTPPEQEFIDASDIWWDVRAPDAILLSGEDVSIRITQVPRDENSSAVARLSNNSIDIRVYVNEGGNVQIQDITFTATNDETVDSVSTEQPFHVKAQIVTTGVKENGIKATLSSNRGLYEISEPVKIVPGTGSHWVTWLVTAPGNSENVDDYLYVDVEAIDLQSEQKRQQRSTELYIPVAQRTVFSFEPFISSPTGLEEKDKLSTDQLFELTTKIIHSGAEFLQNGEFQLRISPPVGFDLEEGESSVKTVSALNYLNNGEHPTWKLTAPSERDENLAEFTFFVEELPHDANSKLPAKTDKEVVTFAVRTVEKARVHFSAYLNDDIMVDSSSVRTGNVLKITAHLDNAGEAGLIGEYQVQLQMPDRFNLAFGDTMLTRTSTLDTTSWYIQSPLEVTTSPDTFTLTLQSLPLDEFAKVPVLLESDSTTIVQVILERGTLIVEDFKVRDNTTITSNGSDLPIFGLSFRNKQVSKSSMSFLQHIKLSIRNKLGEFISPRSFISRVSAVKSNDDSYILAETRSFSDSGYIDLDFTSFELDTIKGSEVDSIKFVVDLVENAEAIDFQFTIDSTSFIEALDEYGLPLIIADSSGIASTFLGISSKMAVVVDTDLATSFFNYPNPFGSAAKPTTSFVYYLEQEGGFKVQVFTLTGELVKSWDLTLEEYPELTAEGLHQGHSQLLWDGKNGMGQPVVNGVYIALITTDYGEQATTKIAVVR